MNSYTIRDVIIYSSDYSRIDNVIEQGILGNRLINHSIMPDGKFLLIFRPFSISKEFEKPVCKRHKKEDDYITKLYEETIRPKSLPKPEASIFQSYLKRVRNNGDLDSDTASLSSDESF